MKNLFSLLLVVIIGTGTATFSQASNTNNINNSSVKDIDGNVYKTVNLGGKIWMAENLRVTRYNDGTNINFTNGANNIYYGAYMNPTIEKNIPEKTIIKESGLLYNGYVIQHGNVCPQGFRIPSNSELEDFWNKYIGYEWSPKWSVIKKLKTFEVPYTYKTGGYYGTKYVSCSNCSYWTDLQKKNNPCTVCRNAREWTVKGDYIPEKTYNLIAKFTTGSANGTDDYGIALDLVGHYSNSNSRIISGSGIWSNTVEYWAQDASSRRIYYGLIIKGDWTIQSSGLLSAKDFYSIRCLSESQQQINNNYNPPINNETISANTDFEELESFNDTANYDKITIGNQVWMSENLNVNKFRNGDPIPEVRTKEEWKRAGEEGKPAWCYYDNDPKNGTKYGKMYNWYAVNDPRGLAPSGYHVPSDTEWKVLTDFLGKDEGKKMKSTSGYDYDGNGTNTSGFSGFPGGDRDPEGTFYFIGSGGYWWSSTEFNTDKAWARCLIYSLVDGTKVYNGFKGKGYSVRCLKD